MPCTEPNWASRPFLGIPGTGGKRPLTFHGKVNKDGTPSEIIHETLPGEYSREILELPCGQCPSCKLERSRQWAARCMHEASLHEENSFVTLTYADEHLPHPNSLHLPHLQKFIKRLRKAIAPQRFRFYACGEYGEKFHRPHYHLALFGLDFRDKIHLGTRNGLPVWRSPLLESKWTKGRSEIGSVTFESAAYIARYIMKKVNGSHAKEHYGHRQPEFTVMSRRPGIGGEWIRTYRQEVLARDSIIVRGHETLPGRYYDLQLAMQDRDRSNEIKEARRERRQTLPPHTMRRREADRLITEVKLAQHSRELD